jgi:single-strand DNA-binding protein
MSKANITIVGHVGKDAESKTTTGGVPVVSFSVGVSDGYADRKTTTWYNVSGWDKLAESIPKFVKKGALVLVAGAFKLREYTDNAGQKKYSPEITAYTVERLDAKAEGGETTNRAAAPAAARTAAAPVARTAPETVKRASTPLEDGTYIDDSDLPW